MAISLRRLGHANDVGRNPHASRRDLFLDGAGIEVLISLTLLMMSAISRMASAASGSIPEYP